MKNSKCVRCGKKALVKNGIRNKVQRYLCTNCAKSMSDSKKPPHRPKGS